jgi:hypothetical protein
MGKKLEFERREELDRCRTSGVYEITNAWVPAPVTWVTGMVCDVALALRLYNLLQSLRTTRLENDACHFRGKIRNCAQHRWWVGLGQIVRKSCSSHSHVHTQVWLFM